MQRVVKPLLIFLFVAWSASAIADDRFSPIKISRYSSINSGVSKEQISILTNNISVSLGQNVNSVGVALQEVLRGSGFRLAESRNSDPYLSVLLAAPLPDIHRNLGPATVEELLVVLAGPAWQLITDPVNRLVSFDLKERYWPCGYSSGANAQC